MSSSGDLVTPNAPMFPFPRVCLPPSATTTMASCLLPPYPLLIRDRALPLISFSCARHQGLPKPFHLTALVGAAFAGRGSNTINVILQTHEKSKFKWPTQRCVTGKAV